MRREWFLWLLVLASVCNPAVKAEPIVVESDGSVRGKFHCGDTAQQPIVFRFALPQVPAEKRWQEKEVFRTVWLTNGVKYTQTVLVTEAPSTGSGVGNERPLVLLVNIEGDNTNGEYAEASAELAVETRGQRQPLELKGGLVWCVAEASRVLVGALEIPESGIKSANGDPLRFYGNMPPSLKGSMTLKIPLGPLAGSESPDWLLDLEFEAALRHALRPQGNTTAHTNAARVTFSPP